MLEGWGISADDWYVTGEASILLGNYPVDYRENIIDIILDRPKWPWPRAEEIGNFIPDQGTKAHDEFEAFVAQHGFTPDIHPMPHVGIRSEDRFEHSYWLPDEEGVRVSYPWVQALHRKAIIEFYEASPNLDLDVFDQKKFLRWKGFLETIQQHAIKIGDARGVEACALALPAVERAIAYFNRVSNVDHGDDIVKGRSAYDGVVEGEVQHWEAGADFVGKIAVLTHSTPAQVTALRHAVGIVTDQGGTLSHAAIIAREYKIPTLIGTGCATSVFQNGDRVKLDAGKGLAIKLSFSLPPPPGAGEGL